VLRQAVLTHQAMESDLRLSSAKRRNGSSVGELDVADS
jgi:hypothetical protein